MSNSSDIPTAMHALQLIAYGPAEQSLKYTTIKTPVIRNPSEILIKVKAVGINPVEAKFRAGNIPSFVFKSPPVILGSDYSGIVVDKGSAVEDFQIGDEVYGALHLPIGQEYGAYAEYLIATLGKGAIAKKPKNMSFEEAAAVGIAAVTAYQGIVIQGDLPRNGPEKILVIGASGGVGTYGVQIAKSLGAHVVAICSGRNAELVSTLGADRVVNYTSKDDMDRLKEESDSFDVILDCIGGDDYYNQLVGLLKKKGVYSTAVGPTMHVGAEKVSIFQGIKLACAVLARTFVGCRSYRVVVHLPWNRFATDLHPLLADGSVKSVLRPDQIFDLKDGAKAHLKIESHRTVGKIVLRV